MTTMTSRERIRSALYITPAIPCSRRDSCVRQVLQKGMEVLVEVGVLVGSRTNCAA